ncbi:MAG: hypothetical protein WC649_11130 [Desulfobacteria bacterium]
MSGKKSPVLKLNYSSAQLCIGIVFTHGRLCRWMWMAMLAYAIVSQTIPLETY